MRDTKRLKDVQRAYAEEIRVAGPVRKNQRIVEAYRDIRRDRFLPPGPWTLHGTVRWRTPDADPAWVHHNVLLSLDKGKGINNGSPSFWAYLFDQLDIAPGERIFQVGAGTGYYTAILAELVGKRGAVKAVEYEKPLAARARANLAALEQVELVQGDAAAVDPGRNVDVIVAFTGGTHIPDLWLDRLAPGGRLLMPLIDDNSWGFMLKVVRRREGFQARALSHASFYLAKGFRTTSEARALKKALQKLKGKLPKLSALHRGAVPHDRRKDAFYVSRTFWLA